MSSRAVPVALGRFVRTQSVSSRCKRLSAGRSQPVDVVGKRPSQSQRKRWRGLELLLPNVPSFSTSSCVLVAELRVPRPLPHSQLPYAASPPSILAECTAAGMALYFHPGSAAVPRCVHSVQTLQ